MDPVFLWVHQYTVELVAALGNKGFFMETKHTYENTLVQLRLSLLFLLLPIIINGVMVVQILVYIG